MGNNHSSLSKTWFHRNSLFQIAQVEVSQDNNVIYTINSQGIDPHDGLVEYIQPPLTNNNKNSQQQKQKSQNDDKNTMNNNDNNDGNEILLKIPLSRNVLQFKFKIAIQLDSSNPHLIEGLTFVNKDTSQDLEDFISNELLHNPNIQNETSVELLGDVKYIRTPERQELKISNSNSTTNSSSSNHNNNSNGKISNIVFKDGSVEFEWCWTWKLEENLNRKIKCGWRNTCCFAEYDKREHRLQTLVRFSFWINDSRAQFPTPISLNKTLPVPLSHQTTPKDPSSSIKTPLSSTKKMVSSSLDNLEDGPVFRATISSLEKKLNTIKPLVKKVLKKSTTLYEHELETSKLQRDLVNSLNELSNPDGIPLLHELIKEFFNSYEAELMKLTEMDTRSLSEFIVEPFKRLYYSDIKSFDQHKRDFEDESREYYNWVSRYLSTKNETSGYQDNDLHHHSGNNNNNSNTVYNINNSSNNNTTTTSNATTSNISSNANPNTNGIGGSINNANNMGGQIRKKSNDTKNVEKRRNFELRRMDYLLFMYDITDGRKIDNVIFNCSKYAETRLKRFSTLNDQLKLNSTRLISIFNDISDHNKNWIKIRSDREIKRRALERSTTMGEIIAVIGSDNNNNSSAVSTYTNSNNNTNTNANTTTTTTTITITNNNNSGKDDTADHNGRRESNIENTSSLTTSKDKKDSRRITIIGTEFLKSNEDDCNTNSNTNNNNITNTNSNINISNNNTSNNNSNNNNSNNTNITSNVNNDNTSQDDEKTIGQSTLKEGLLWALSKPGGINDPLSLNKINWHKYWVVVADGKLCEYSNWKQGTVDLHNEPIELKMALVREARNSDRRFCFEVVTPSFKRVFQAVSEADMNGWINSITNAISTSLEDSKIKDSPLTVNKNSHSDNGSHSIQAIFNKTESHAASFARATGIKRVVSSSKTKSNSLKSDYGTSGKKRQMKIQTNGPGHSYSLGHASHNHSHSAYIPTPISPTIQSPIISPTTSLITSSNSTSPFLQSVRNADPSNSRCADCGSTKKVEWISLNLLAVICIECSGAHRSLGTHITKIRSLLLDVKSFTVDVVELLNHVSNKKLNDVFEAKLGTPKLEPNCTPEERFTYISKKYEFKMFAKSVNDADITLIKSIKAFDVYNILASLACGAKVTQQVINSKRNILSLIEYALIEESKRCELLENKKNLYIFPIVEFLILNGANVPDKIPEVNNLPEAAKAFWTLKINRLNGNTGNENFSREIKRARLPSTSGTTTLTTHSPSTRPNLTVPSQSSSTERKSIGSIETPTRLLSISQNKPTLAPPEPQISPPLPPPLSTPGANTAIHHSRRSSLDPKVVDGSANSHQRYSSLIPKDAKLKTLPS